MSVSLGAAVFEAEGTFTVHARPFADDRLERLSTSAPSAGQSGEPARVMDEVFGLRFEVNLQQQTPEGDPVRGCG